MKIGEMRDRIIFKQKADSFSSPYVNLNDDEYIDYVTVWAKVEYLNGREFWSAKAVNAEQTVRFIIRYRKDVTTDMKVYYNEKSFNITSVQPLENNKQWLVIIANEVFNSGS